VEPRAIGSSTGWGWITLEWLPLKKES
jgi:hypothetical protein